jgi:integrase/recombinase XerD
VVWTLLDTGLRVAELAGLTKDNIDWQQKRLTIYGKGMMYPEI